MKHRQPFLHICSFSALKDLPKKHHGSDRHILAAINNAGRFSCFEVTETQKLARTVTRLVREGKIETTDLGYPWTGAKLTEAGRAALSEDG